MTQGIYAEDERRDLIEREYKRISGGLAGLDEGRRTMLDKLYHEAAFMAVTLEETRQTIIRDGITEQYQNGANQSGVKKSAAVEVYDKMVNTYAKVIAQINRELPQGDQIGAADELLEFLRKGRRPPHREKEIAGRREPSRAHPHNRREVL